MAYENSSASSLPANFAAGPGAPPAPWSLRASVPWSCCSMSSRASEQACMTSVDVLEEKCARLSRTVSLWRFWASLARSALISLWIERRMLMS